MAATPPSQDQVARLSLELDALRVIVKALAEIAEQPRLQPAMKEHLEEHVHSMRTARKSDAEIALFIGTYSELRDSF